MDFKREIELIDQQIAELTKKKNELQKRMQEQNNMSFQKKPLTTPEQNWENICNELEEAYRQDEKNFLYDRLDASTKTTTMFLDFYKSSQKYLILRDIFHISISDESVFKYLCSLVLIKPPYKHPLVRTHPALTATKLKSMISCNVVDLKKENETFQYIYSEIMSAYEKIDNSLESCENYLIYTFSEPVELGAQFPGMKYKNKCHFIIAAAILHEPHNMINRESLSCLYNFFN